MDDLRPQHDYSTMTDGVLRIYQDSIKPSIAKLREDIERLQNELLQLITDDDAITEVLDARRVAAQDKSAPDWAMLLEGDSSKARSDALDKALYALTSSGEYAQGLSAYGAYSEVNQRALQVALYKHDTDLTARVAAALEMLLPYLKPLAAEKYMLDELEEGAPYIRIGVLEKTLSRDGVYWIALQPEKGFAALCKTTNGHARIVKRRGSLKGLLEGMQDMCYYQNAKAAA